jgi:FtsP/CotA-like multicopper oxidase with cupredoxin domain
MLALAATPAVLQLAHAGAGWGDSADPVGAAIKTPTYYANSPSGFLPLDATGVANDCFLTTPPATGGFSTATPIYSIPIGTNAAGGTCDTGTALRKFVDTLNPILGGLKAAVADTTTYPGSDYYIIGLVDYTQQMHTDLPKQTQLRGYVQLNETSPGVYTRVGTPSYLGPVIVATQGRPTRVKFVNQLSSGIAGDLKIPVDETISGAGLGPDDITKFQQNRAELHLHGGDNPWISDGTPQQWILPKADEMALMAAGKTALARGAGAKNVPDMPDPGPGAMTYYWPNGSSARMMFYHDHALGITRLNVYAGEAAGYIVRDPVEQALIGTVIPADEIPLVIQDRTFVPKNIAMQDAKWNTTKWGAPGDLWFPHVYETNQDPNSFDGTNPVGRWDWGNWFWPVFPSTYALPTGEVSGPLLNADGTPVVPATTVSQVSTTPEAFMDTPIVNGKAYPTMTVDPKAYRIRILNAANDRFMNLGLYVAADKNTTNSIDPTNPLTQPVVCNGIARNPFNNTVPAVSDCTEVKMVHFDASYPTAYLETGAFPTTTGPNGTGWGTPNASMFPMGVPDPLTAGPNFIQIGNEGGFLAQVNDIPSTIINYEYNKRSVTVLNTLERGLFLGPAERADTIVDFSQYAGQTLILYNDAPAPVPASDPRIDYFTGNGDQTTAGGAPNTMPGYGPNTRTVMQIHVNAGTPVPYNKAGLIAALPAAFATTNALHKPVVPEPEFSPALTGMPAARTNARIYTGSVYLNAYQPLAYTTLEPTTYFPAPTCSTVALCNTALANQKANPVAPAGTVVVPNGHGLVTAPAGTAIRAFVESKAIQELFDPTYGRMNATLGIELPFTSAITQTTIPLGYVDPTTETVADGETQFWKITHNGVDTHPVHFHLVNVQVINRVGWDGTVKPPLGDEFGWKETVKMHPLEDIVVAVRAKKPTLTGVAASGTTPAANGFGLPLSSRQRDTSQPLTRLDPVTNTQQPVTLGFTQVNPATGNAAVVTNQVDNYGWEYVWHCHILGHEENDFMRPVVFNANEAAAAAPTGLTVSSAGVLTWTDVATTEYAYQVLRGATDLTTPALVPYTAQVKGVAPLANATTFTDPGIAALAPAAPVLSVTSVAAPVLTWISAANPTGGFNIMRATVTGGVPGAYSQIGVNQAGTLRTYTDSTAAVGTTYAYQVVALGGTATYTVTAIGAGGNGSTTVTSPALTATSAAVQATTPGGVVTPSLVAVTNLTAQLSGSNVVALGFTNLSTGETGYQVQVRRTARATATTDAATVSPNRTINFSLTGGTNTGGMGYIVAPTVTIGGGTTCTVPPVATISAGAVTGISTATGCTGTSNTVTIAAPTGWNVMSPASYVFAAPPGINPAPGVAMTATVAITMPNNSTTSFSVAPLNGATVGPVSNVPPAIVLTTAPAAPTALSTTLGAVGSHAITVNWTDASPSNSAYQWQVRTATTAAGISAAGWSATTAIAGNATTFTYSSGITGNFYQFRLRAVNANGNSNWVLTPTGTGSVQAP